MEELLKYRDLLAETLEVFDGLIELEKAGVSTNDPKYLELVGKLTMLQMGFVQK